MKIKVFRSVKYPFNDFLYGAVFITSVGHKKQILYSIYQHVPLENFTNMYTILYTQNSEKHSFARKTITVLRGIPVAFQHKIGLRKNLSY